MNSLLAAAPKCLAASAALAVALLYGPTSGFAQASAGVAQLDVANQSRGIAPDQVERVFQRFVRLDTSRQRGAGGTGLGLSIAQQIVRSHDGDLSVAEHSGGARFVLRLPTRPDPSAGST